MIDRSKLSYYGGDRIDQIIGIKEGVINVPAPTLLQNFRTAEESFAHGFGDSVYFAGIFSADGGVTWNDFGAQIPTFNGIYSQFQTCDCNAIVTPSNLTVKAISWYDNAFETGRAYTVMYKVFLIAKNTMASSISPLPTAEVLSLTGSINTQKVALAGTAAISVSSNNTGSVTVNHNLGYIPKVRAWFFQSSSPDVCRPIVPDLTSLNYSEIEVKIYDDRVVFYVDAGGFSTATVGNIEYRVYYDD